MKVLKNQKNIAIEKSEKVKVKKKMAIKPSKVNVRSTKFWSEVFNEEGDNIEKDIG